MIKNFIRNHQLLVCFIIVIDSLFLVGTIIHLLIPIRSAPPPPITARQPVNITSNLVPGKDYIPGHVSVRFKHTVSWEVINTTLAENNAKIIDQIPSIGSSLLEVAPGRESFVVDVLKRKGLVEYAELDVLRQDHAFMTNDPEFSKQYGLPKIKAPEAWDITRGKGVIIANIQDGGADTKHPDLAPNILSGDGNALHGTHTSGIMAAAGNNGIGVSGTCPECKLIVINLAGYTSANIAKGLTMAADSKAKVINMSFGGGIKSQQEIDAVNYAWSKGAIPVASAGNDGISSPGFPASYPHVVAVGATDAGDQKPPYSNFGPWVKIAAPGDKIVSTLPNNQYGPVSGTSMAAPMISGVLGLIWSTSYGTTQDAVVQRLCSTADKIAGTGTNMTCGRVNAFTAVQGGNPAPAPSSAPSNGTPNPSFFPLAPCPTCSNPSDPTIAPTMQQPQSPAEPQGDPTLGVAPSGALSGQPATLHGGGSKGLITILLTFLLLLLKLFTHMG